jgi:hypothetical protein
LKAFSGGEPQTFEIVARLLFSYLDFILDLSIVFKKQLLKPQSHPQQPPPPKKAAEFW